MADITVQEIIATFKNVKRKEITSSADTDDFLEIMKKKSHWTLEEYKEFSLEYALQNMITSVMDFMQISRVKRKYNFQLTWSHYFQVIESIKNVRKQKKYVNYYIWYYYQDMTQEIYEDFMKKPYFELLTTKGKVNFLRHTLKTDKHNSWVIDYFTPEEIKSGLSKSSLNIMLRECNSFTTKDIDQIKNFYNTYERFMDYKTKQKIFYEIINTGIISLIQYFHQEKGIQKINKLKVLWHLCTDVASPNTIEVVTFLKSIGLRITPSVLRKFEANNKWIHLEHRVKLLNYFKDVEREKNYLKLDKKIKKKEVKTILRKI